MQTDIWAHRGASHHYIENTIAAFDKAIKIQADGIELDVQRTKDGKLVVYHDEKLHRLTESKQLLADLTWHEIQQLTLSAKKNALNYANISNTKIPSLEEVLNFLKSTGLTINIELKNSINFYPGMEKEVAALVAKKNMQKQVLYSSFNHASMNFMSDLVGSKYCAILTSDIQFEPWHYMQEIDAGAYHPMINSLQDIYLVNKLQEHDLNVHVWTADEEAYIYAGLLLGVDAIITNKPEKAINLRKQFHSDGGQKAIDSVKKLGIKI